MLNGAFVRLSPSELDRTAQVTGVFEGGPWLIHNLWGNGVAL